MWTYEQATGALSKDGEVVGEGYSGFGGDLRDRISSSGDNQLRVV